MQALKVVRWGGLLLLLAASFGAAAWDADEETKWVESAIALPAPPKDENLLRFEVSRLTSNIFYIDAVSLSIGDDGVVRYTLVVQSPSGVRNVSYEGMRCSTAERRSYAYGAADGGWSPARQSAWSRIRGNSLNRQYAALFSEYFCVPGSEVTSAVAAVSALRRGGAGMMTP